MPDEPMEVNGGASIPGAVSLTAAITFYGRDTSGKAGAALRINEFLQDVESRKQQHGWEDAAVIRFARACFKGEANDWFNNYKESLHREGLDIYDDWNRFKAAIKEHYGAGGATRRVNWRRMLTQGANEDAWRFTTRMLNDVTQWTKENEPMIAKSRDLRLGDMARQLDAMAARDILFNVANANNIPDPIKAALQARCDALLGDLRAQALALLQRLQDNAAGIIIDVLSRDAFIDGLTSPKVRAEAIRLITLEPDITTMKFHDKLGHFEAMQRAAGVNEVDAEEPKQPSTGPVEAVKNKGNDTAKKTDGDPKVNRHANLVCRYCQKKGHIQRNCKKKKRDEKAGEANANNATTKDEPKDPGSGTAF